MGRPYPAGSVVPGPFGTIENLSERTCSRLAYPGGRTPVDEQVMAASR
jgi:hypothetical protein